MKLSIIIPVYNAEKYLKETIESIISQEEAYELILIDDGSKDGSLSICNHYATYDNRIQVIHIDNGGVSNARNVGLEIARGEYIQFVDSDDKLTKGALKKIFYEIKSGVDVIVFSYCTFGKEQQEIIIPKMEDVSLQQNVAFLLEKGFIVSCFNKVYKRSIIRTTKFRTDLSYAEDYCFNLEVFRNITSITMISDIIYQYRKRDESLSEGYDEKNFVVADFIREKSIELLQQFGSDGVSMAEKNYAYTVNNIVQRMIRRQNLSFFEKVGLMKKHCGEEYIEAVNCYYPGVYGKLLRKKLFALVVMYMQILNRKKK